MVSWIVKVECKFYTINQVFLERKAAIKTCLRHVFIADWLINANKVLLVAFRFI